MDISVVLSLLLMLGLAFAIGANDETLATLVGTRAVKLKYAILVGAILVFAGVLFLSQQVGKTIGSNLLGSSVEYSVHMMLAIIVSTTVWLIFASQIGAPISTTHSIVGSVFGIALTLWLQGQSSLITALNWQKMGEVVLSWIISPILGFIGAVVFQIAVSKGISYKIKGLTHLENVERYFLYALIIAVSWTQFSRGGNDSANALGILYGLIESGDVAEQSRFVWVLISGLMLSFGLIVVGRNVIKNVGQNLIELRPSDAFSIQISTSIVIFFATILGLPVSGTHILIFAILGSGYVKGEKPDKKSFQKMVLSWFLTFPVAAILSGFCFLIFKSIIA